MVYVRYVFRGVGCSWKLGSAEYTEVIERHLQQIDGLDNLDESDEDGGLLVAIQWRTAVSTAKDPLQTRRVLTLQAR